MTSAPANTGWRDELATELEAAARELDAATDPVACVLNSTVGRLNGSATIPVVRQAIADFAKLAADLGELDRELARRAAVERLRALGVPDPARLIRAAFADSGGNNGKPTVQRSEPGTPLSFRPIEPWPERVDGALLLDELYGTVRRYVSISESGAIATAAWILHAHTHDAAEVSPILAITSPTKRCGKTTLLTVIGALVPRALFSSNITAAAVYRVIEAYRPTLLVDEADTFVAMRDELRGVLNGAHFKPTAQVVRTVGDNHEIRAFSSWTPKVVALIGGLPDTLQDRAIAVTLERRTVADQVERLRIDRIFAELEELRRKCTRWAADNLERLRSADPEMPQGLNDRAADNWRPLLAIADAVGSVWPQEVRQAALALARGESQEDAGVTLLADLREIFAGEARLTTEAILKRLHEMPDRPWPEWSHGKPITARGLARLLGRFGIKSAKWRELDRIVRGYVAGDFVAAWDRYVADRSATETANATAKSLQDNAVAFVADVAAPGDGTPSPPPQAPEGWQPPAWLTGEEEQ